MRSTVRTSGFFGAALPLWRFGALAEPAGAVEISKHASDSATVNAIQLKGQIDDGDTFDLQVYIANLPKKPTIVVYLNSPGGNLREGMRLGKFFFDNKIETAVETKTLRQRLRARLPRRPRRRPASRTAPRRQTAGSASTRSRASSTTRATAPTT